MTMAKRPKGTGSIFRKPGSRCWWISYTHNGQRHREATGCLKKWEAERLLKQRLAEIQGGSFVGPEIERIRVSEIAAGLLADYRINAKSIAWAERCWSKHLAPFFEKMRAATVGTDAL